jgi:hypothetical protein
MVLGRGGPALAQENGAGGAAAPEATSKRQEKLRKRSEKGDPRVKAQQVRR